MTDTIIDVVDLAKVFKDFISFNDVRITANLKNNIFLADDDAFLWVRKKIGSATTILDVKLVNDDMINKAILGEE